LDCVLSVKTDNNGPFSFGLQELVCILNVGIEKNCGERLNSGSLLILSSLNCSFSTEPEETQRMQPFSTHTGMVMPLDRVNVDTDQMVPKQFLKALTRDGFGRILFYDWRYLPGEKPNPEFVLNFPRYQGASVLLARANFGCGSSREHAPWGVKGLRFPRRDRAELCGHFLQQLLQKRHPARDAVGE